MPKSARAVKCGIDNTGLLPPSAPHPLINQQQNEENDQTRQGMSDKPCAGRDDEADEEHAAQASHRLIEWFHDSRRRSACSAIATNASRVRL